MQTVVTQTCFSTDSQKGELQTCIFEMCYYTCHCGFEKRARIESAGNLLRYLFPLLIHTLEKETTTARDKTKF